MAENVLNTVDDSEAGYGQLFAVLIRRKFWFFGVFAIVLAIATVQALKQKPTFESSLQLLVEPNYQGKQQGEGAADAQFTDSNVEIDNATQLSLMRSTQLIEKAVKRLEPEYRDISVDEIRNSLSVAQVAQENDSGQKVETKIFEATYNAGDPLKTQKVLEAMQQVYQEYNRDQQKQRLAKGLAFIDEQLPKLRRNVAQAETALEKFRTNQSLIEPEAEAKTLNDNLNALVQERRTNQAQYRELQARYNTLQQQLASSPQKALVETRLSQSTRYQTLLNEIQKTELAIAEQRKRFTDDNPTIQKLASQRDEQLALLHKEGGYVLGSNTALASNTEESLLKQGQLGESDVNLTNELLKVQTDLRGLMAREQTLAHKERQLRDQLDRFPGLLAEYNRIQPNIKLQRDRLEELEKARQELSLEIDRGGFEWQVVEKPQVGWQTGPKTQQSILLGAVVGLMLGGIAAFAREVLDDSVHSSNELKQQVPLPLLGITPELPPGKTSGSMLKLPFGKQQALPPGKSKPIVKRPFDKPQVLAPWTVEVIHWPPSWESLDLIYKNIQLLNSVSTLKSLTITSALASEGKSTLALGLAISAARLHQRVLLIDADLRHPTLHEQLELPNEYGLSTLLECDATLPRPSSSIHTSDSHIDVLTSGPIPTDPVSLLSSYRMKELMATFEQTYDLVILDAPPVVGMVDALLAASYCQGVVLVARINQVTKTALTEATTMLSKLNTIGIIANGGSSPSKSDVSYAKKDRVLLQQAMGK